MENKQLYLKFPKLETKQDIIIGNFNRLAATLIIKEKPWLTNVLYLYGEPFVGKTLLAKYFIKKHHGQEIFIENIHNLPNLENTIKQNNVLLLDNLQKLTPQNEERIFHLYNLIASLNKKLIITSNYSPKELDINLLDLQSRIYAATILHITTPDEESLKAIFLQTLFTRQLQINNSMLNYIFKRIERSPKEIKRLADAIEHHINIEKKTLTLAIIKKLL